MAQKRGFIVLVRDLNARQRLGVTDVEVVGMVERHGMNGGVQMTHEAYVAGRRGQSLTFKIDAPCEIVFSTYNQETRTWKHTLSNLLRTARSSLRMRKARRMLNKTRRNRAERGGLTLIMENPDHAESKTNASNSAPE